MTSIVSIITQERRKQLKPLLLATGCSVMAAGAAVGLLGLSGWFITGAALAGIAGTSLAFNYMLPSAVIRLLAIVRTAGRYGERLEGHRATLYALAGIRTRLFQGLVAAPLETLKLATGEASARLGQDVDAIQAVFIRRPTIWAAATAILSGVTLTALAAGAAGGSTVLLAGIAILGGSVISRRISARAGAEVQRATGRLKERYAAVSSAAPELVCYGLEDWASGEVGKASAALGDARTVLSKGEGALSILLHGMTALAAVSALLLAQAAPLGMATLAALAAAAALEGAGALVRTFSGDGAVREAQHRLDAILKRRYDKRSMTPRDGDLGVEVGRTWHTVPTGGRLAIVGVSGSGKTTLLERLMGLQPSPRGLATVDGVDIDDIAPVALRTLFAFAPQDAAVISGTVRENLLLGNPHASEEAIWAALHDAALGERVRRLPDGLDTWIGENGARLSGGERRRLCLARAFLKPAPWLLLDEPSEGLDNATEALIVARLSTRLHSTGQGLIIVSHRPRPSTLCEAVAEMDVSTELWAA